MLKRTSHVEPLLRWGAAVSRLHSLQRMRKRLEVWDVPNFSFLALLAEYEALEASDLDIIKRRRAR